MSAYSVTYAEYLAAGSYPDGDDVTLADSAATLQGLSVLRLSRLAAHGIDVIDATDDVLSLGISQFQALGPVELSAGDLVTVSGDGGSVVGALLEGPALFGRVDVLDLTADYTISLQAFRDLGGARFADGHSITIQETNGLISGMQPGEIRGLAAHGIDVIRSQPFEANFTWNVSQAEAFVHQKGGGAVSIAPTDLFYVTDYAPVLEGVSATDLARFGAAAGSIIYLTSLGGPLAFGVAQYRAMAANSIIALTTSVVSDAGARLGSLGASEIAALASFGFTGIDATDNALSLSVAQLTALGQVHLSVDDTVTLADSAVVLEAVDPSYFTFLAAIGVQVIDARPNVVAFDVDQAAAILQSGLAISASDQAALADAGVVIGALSDATLGQLAGAGFDRIDLTDGAVSLTAAQYQALGAVTFAGGDVVTVTGSGGADAITTGGERDVLKGRGGDDALSGGSGRDVLDGGPGADVLTGGANPDIFTFDAIGDTARATPDQITDFSAGDLIDLSRIDADAGAPGRQHFHLGATSGHAGDIEVGAYDAVHDRTYVDLYVDGDKTVDGRIVLAGDHHDLTATDFVL